MKTITKLESAADFARINGINPEEESPRVGQTYLQMQAFIQGFHQSEVLAVEPPKNGADAFVVHLHTSDLIETALERWCDERLLDDGFGDRQMLIQYYTRDGQPTRTYTIGGVSPLAVGYVDYPYGTCYKLDLSFDAVRITDHRIGGSEEIFGRIFEGVEVSSPDAGGDALLDALASVGIDAQVIGVEHENAYTEADAEEAYLDLVSAAESFANNRTSETAAALTGELLAASDRYSEVVESLEFDGDEDDVIEAELVEDEDPYRTQIDLLAQFIIDEVYGEPSQSEGVGETAIRLLKVLSRTADRLSEEMGRRISPVNVEDELREFVKGATVFIDQIVEQRDEANATIASLVAVLNEHFDLSTSGYDNVRDEIVGLLKSHPAYLPLKHLRSITTELPLQVCEELAREDERNGVDYMKKIEVVPRVKTAHEAQTVAGWYNLRGRFVTPGDVDASIGSFCVCIMCKMTLGGADRKKLAEEMKSYGIAEILYKGTQPIGYKAAESGQRIYWRKEDAVIGPGEACRLTETEEYGTYATVGIGNAIVPAAVTHTVREIDLSTTATPEEPQQ